MKIVSWNVARRSEPWRWLLDMDADLALLQEAAPPPSDVAGLLEVNPGPFEIAGGYQQPQRWRTAIVRLSDRIKVEWIESRPIADAGASEFAVSIPGTVASCKGDATGDLSRSSWSPDVRAVEGAARIGRRTTGSLPTAPLTGSSLT